MENYIGNYANRAFSLQASTSHATYKLNPLQCVSPAGIVVTADVKDQWNDITLHIPALMGAVKLLDLCRVVFLKPC